LARCKQDVSKMTSSNKLTSSGLIASSRKEEMFHGDRARLKTLASNVLFAHANHERAFIHGLLHSVPPTNLRRGDVMLLWQRPRTVPHSRAYCEKSAFNIKSTAQAKDRTFILVSRASYRSSEHHNYAQLVVVHAISDVSRWLDSI
jgi:hypothetical protein